jgi:hypothetical protein
VLTILVSSNARAVGRSDTASGRADIESVQQGRGRMRRSERREVFFIRKGEERVTRRVQCWPPAQQGLRRKGKLAYGIPVI